MIHRTAAHSLAAPLAHLADVLSPLAGQRIALIAPAGGVDDQRIDTALTVLEAAGVHAHLGDHARDHHRYLAGTVQARLDDFHAAFELADIRAVWCLRGGYGSTQLIEHIDWRRIPAEIPLIGFSDATALLEAFRRRGRAAIHGPVATQLAVPGDTLEQQNTCADSLACLVEILQGRSSEWPLTPFFAPSGAIRGRLVGGNLTTLASLAGTPAALRLTADTIVLLEDVGEAEFRLERCFYQLLGSIDQSRLKAVCLGGFEHCALSDGIRSLAEIIFEWTRAHGIPVFCDAPIGHGNENRAFLYDRQVSITEPGPDSAGDGPKSVLR